MNHCHEKPSWLPGQVRAWHVQGSKAIPDCSDDMVVNLDIAQMFRSNNCEPYKIKNIISMEPGVTMGINFLDEKSAMAAIAKLEELSTEVE